ncbi:hypothetical protein BG261_01675 [Floricoccus tropicus]|uniref:CHY-type domain-containing protein n=1 Tax=Floricoccus tropicus TaxID=1859473 RepID=A0A1E8GMC1_9LACT|nr:CHY zinc finger protein [Floricoccus tropicus]OFI49317.1 hypothetical protein BG261_01675 [Floricoccus tropicus]
MEKVYGFLVDNQGRCQHYHTDLDIIANRCQICNKLYSCFKCHDENELHSFEGFDFNSNKLSVMCCVCGQEFSYKIYSELTNCPSCKSAFNPRCKLHKNIYTKATN